VLDKARFWERISDSPINKSSANRVLEGFQGKLTTTKYASLVKCSQDTAYRDILAMVDQVSCFATPKAGAARAIRSTPLPGPI
jgi:Fic family protein